MNVTDDESMNNVTTKVRIPKIQLRTLRYLDQTPINRPENKKLCSELSPLAETDDPT